MTYPLSHDGLSDDPRVIFQVVNYLKAGSFAGEHVEYFACDGGAAAGETSGLTR